MRLNDYIEMRKEELFGLEQLFLQKNKEDPQIWPLEMSEGEWYSQELAYNETERGE